MPKKGWFRTQEYDGDRTLEQQLIGLEELLAKASGMTVLDVGCAEGLIGRELLERGASQVHGIDTVGEYIQRAKRNQGRHGATFAVANGEAFEPGEYDIVLLLAVLHKMKMPMTTAIKFGRAAKRMCVVRLPPAGATFRDPRSGNKPIDVTAAMHAAGLELASAARGSFNAWIGYYVRPGVLAASPPPEPVVAAPAPDPEPMPTPAVPTPPAPEPEATPAPSDSPPTIWEKTMPVKPADNEVHLQSEEGQPPYAPPPTDSEPPAEGNTPPNSVHPGGDPAAQDVPERIEPPAMEGTVKDTVRRDRDRE